VEPRLIPAENNIELIVAIGETKQMSQKEKNTNKTTTTTTTELRRRQTLVHLDF
jgi:hypothetical protein